MYLKKTIVLSAVDESANKAVLNVEKFKNRVEGQIKLYNFKQEVQGILTLGFLKDGKVVKAGLQKIENMKFSFVIQNDEDLAVFQEGNVLTCALVNFQEGRAKPLLFGASDGRLPKSTDLALARGIQLFESPLSVEKTEEFLNQEDIEYEEELKNEIEEQINVEMSCCENKCADCKYRQAFYDINIQQEEKERKLQFYEDVKSQLDELFDKYPEEDILKTIIPNSKWVKVDYEDNGEYFVIGLIYGEDGLKYICYGVPGVEEQMPESQIGYNAQWLPIVPENPSSFGYWITYQDAQNGENIKMEII